MKRIGLVAAMASETEHLLEKLGTKIASRIICGFLCITYTIDGKTIYLVNSGVGEINSSAATMLLISRFDVQAVINFGVAGALKKGVKVGDLLIGRDIVHYDFDISVFTGRSKAAYPDSKTPFILCDAALADLADKANGAMLQRVRIASGDKFIAATEFKNEIIREFDADICEMESAGIIRTSDRAGVPSLFIKTVSDEADESAPDCINDTINKGVTSYCRLIENLLRII